MSDQEQLELERIKASVMEYVEGVVEFDFEKGMHPWHSDGLKISYDHEKKELVRKTILQTKPDLTPEEIERVKTKLSESGTIISVDRTGNAAFVKLVWLSKTSAYFRETTDYILLLKIEDEWKIVSKVFHINDLEVD
ncbi:MAG: nuclear transport factor 2 family protein [Candidatus Thorarchaeota archaeon]